MSSIPGIGNITIEVVAGVLVILSSSAVAWYARKLNNTWSKRAEKLDELYQAFFGMEDVGTMEGVVDIVESHDNELENHHNRIDDLEDKIEEGKRRRERLDARIKKLKDRVGERED